VNRQAYIEEVFDQVRRLEDPNQREAFLNQTCGADLELRASLEELLSLQNDAEVLFCPLPEAKGPTASPPTASEPPTEAPGTFIGRYKLLEKIGEGGFGVVYLAEQREPVKRRVALKVIKLGMDTRQVVARFEAERQALALMDHPSIAKVLDGGTTETGRPYFVMELVRGVPITAYCEQSNLGIPERVELFVQVCHAVQHAHQKGVIHRDLKPTNILVTQGDGQATPKVIDFGVAKAIQQELTEKTIFTQFHHFIGTPAYMSPEQADLTTLDIDTRSDIYSLGVVLYQLLTGQTPFDGNALLASGLDEMRRTIREVEPARPSTRMRRRRTQDASAETLIPNHQSQIDPDLDWIVMKCLEKDRGRRYETANGLAMDLRRHLAREPVVARPPSLAYRMERFIERNRAFSLAALVAVLALISGGAVSGWALVREREAHRQAEQQLHAALGFMDQMLKEVAPNIEGLTGAAQARETLGQASLKFVKALRPALGEDSALRVMLARALQYVSSAQSTGIGNTVGHFEEGLKHAQEACALLNEPIPQLPEPERLRLLLEARYSVCHCLWGLGRWEEGNARLADVEGVVNQMELWPELARNARQNRSGIRGCLAYSLVLMGKPEQALKVLESAEERQWTSEVLKLGGAAKLSGVDCNELAVVANHFNNHGTALGLLSRFEEAVVDAGEEVRIWSLLVEQRPKEVIYQVRRAEGWAQQGWVLTATGHTNEGLKKLESSRQEVERLVSQDPANDNFKQARVAITSLQALGFAAWSAVPGASGQQKRERMQQAEMYSSEGAQFASAAKSKEAGARMAFTRRVLDAGKAQLETGRKE
jgi:hypothetical protein